MATTQNEHNGNGQTNRFSFTFPYIKENDVKVSVRTSNNDVTPLASTAYTFPTATEIQLNAFTGDATTFQETSGAPKNGVTLRIYRETDIDNPKAVYYPGSSIRAQDLNDNTLQNLYAEQERQNRAVDAIGGGVMKSNLTMEQSDIVFEGDTVNEFETTLTVADPSADRTITLPDVSGTVITTGDVDTVTSDMLTNNIDIAGTLDVTGATVLDSTLDVEGNIDAAGDLDVNGTSNLNNVDIDGSFHVQQTAMFAGYVNAAGFNGNITGNVTGNVTGGVTGNVTGNVSGSATSLLNARNIAGQSFDGTADIDISLNNLNDVNIGTPNSSDNGKVLTWDNSNSEFTLESTTTSSSIADGSITTAKIEDDAVTYAKMQHTTTANRVLGATTVGTIGETQVATDMIANDAVTYGKMQHTTTDNRVLGATTAGAIGETQVATDMIANDAVTYAKMQDISTDHRLLGRNNASTADVTEVQVATDMITDDAVISAKIADDAVISAKIANDAVTYAKMQNIATANRVLGRASAGEIQEVQVAADMIAANAVTSAKIEDDAVTTAKIEDDAVTGAKIENNVAIGGTGAFVVPKGTAAEQPDASVTPAVDAASDVAGAMRYNTSSNEFEFRNNEGWYKVLGGVIDLGQNESFVNWPFKNDDFVIPRAAGSGTVLIKVPYVNSTNNTHPTGQNSRVSFEAPSTGNPTVTISPPDNLSQSYNLVFPADAGSIGEYLKAGTGGALEWGGVDIVTDTTPQLGGMLDVNGNSIGDGTHELLKFSETASAVNEFTITNAATNDGPVLSASGGDTNINIVIAPKGTGSVDVNNSKITNVTIPTSDSDAATKKYVDDEIAGNSNTNTTYSQSSVADGDDVNLRLTAGGSGSGDDDILLTAGSNITFSSVSANGFTIAATDTDTNTTYTHTANADGDNVNLRLTAGGSGSGNDDILLTAGNNITFSSVSDGGFTIAATDTNTEYSAATTSADGLMSSTDKSKLDGIDAGANNYSLPTADASTVGGFKVVDEDAMGSNADDAVPTQQSVKAYVNANAGVNLTGTQTLQNKTLDEYAEAVDTETSNNITVIGPGANNGGHIWTMTYTSSYTGNNAITIGINPGQSLLLHVTAGNNSVEFMDSPSNPVSWVGGTAPTLSTSGVSVLEFYKIHSGNTIYGAHVGDI